MSPNINKSEFVTFSSPASVFPGAGSTDATATSENIGLPPKPSFNTSSHYIRNNRYDCKDKPIRPLASNRCHRDRLWLNLDKPLQETRFVGMFNFHVLFLLHLNI